MRTLKTSFLFFLSFLLLAPVSQASAKKNSVKNPKYIFYFIGDGMGMGSLVTTQFYKAGNMEKPEIAPLCFTQFPYSGLLITHSSDSGVTDSAAAGTALSTGSKTSSRTVGMLPDRETPLVSIACKAHEKGWRVGIATTTCIDDATPAAFFAHVPVRYDQHVIGMQLVDSEYEFFGGYGFRQDKDKDHPDMDKGIVATASESGYTVVNSYADYQRISNDADKVILFTPQEDNNEQIPYQIDATPADLTMEQVFNAGFDFLQKKEGKFFYMFEGGSIDHAAHGNDAATLVTEILTFDACIETAFNFYKQHPDETLIVVTADHSTSGCTPGDGGYYLNIPVLANQKMSEGAFAKYLKAIAQKEGLPTWERVKQELTLNFGFWDKIRINPMQEQALKEAYEQSFTTDGVKQDLSEDNLYSYYKTDKLSDRAVKIINDIAQVGWISGDHDGGYVPVFAVGVGAENFSGQMQNIEVPDKIAAIAGF